jgi:hypothetical protein
MNAISNIEPSPLAKLREPFAPNHISKLPKPTKAQNDAVKADFKKGKRCDLCGGWHHPDVVHLDYVGHAALTDRLLDTDPEWFWEPVAFGQDGLPALDRNGGLWIKLTVLGVTRLGYGDADGKQGGNAIKEAIGDALRNAAMRFGAALDLWHKGDLHGDEADEPEEKGRGNREEAAPQGMPDAAWAKLANLMKATSTNPGVLIDHYQVKDLRQLNIRQYNEAIERLEQRLAEAAKAETNRTATGNDLADDDIAY